MLESNIKGRQQLDWKDDHSPDDTDGPAVEITCNAEDECATFGDAFLLICPFARDLDTCFDGLCASVHWEDHVIAKEVVDLFRKGAKNRVIERPRGKGEALSLLHQGGHDAGVAVPLINGAVTKISSGIDEAKKHGRAGLGSGK